MRGVRSLAACGLALFLVVMTASTVIGTPDTVLAETPSRDRYVKPDAGTSPGRAYLGCYRDQGDRDLNEHFISENSMTVERCVSICGDKGFPFAGVQYSTQCFCGNSYGKSGSADNCDMPCGGNSSQKCGGVWANAVYKTLQTRPDAAASQENVDIGGVWDNSGASTWTFTPLGGNKYKAQEKGLGNAFGTATVNGRNFRIDHNYGYYDVTVSADGRTASGRWWDNGQQAGGPNVHMKRMSAPVSVGASSQTKPDAAASQENVDIGGVWDNSGASTWTFTPLGGNKYKAQEKGLGNAFGTAIVNGRNFRIKHNRGYYDVTVSADGRTASGRWWDDIMQSGGPDVHMKRMSAASAAGGAQETILSTMNPDGVGNGPTQATVLNISRPYQITSIMTYHWNNGRGTPSGGTLGLRASDGTMYGPWGVHTTPGQGGVPNANWIANPNVVIPPGSYTVIDSSPATWSQNGTSGGRGMAEIKGSAQ